MERSTRIDIKALKEKAEGGFLSLQESRAAITAIKDTGKAYTTLGRMSKGTSRVTKTGERGLYGSWYNMMQRCYNPKMAQFHRYGGRGISVVQRWHIFTNFYVDMRAGWKPGLAIDRIDNDKNYCYENCQWLSRGENSTKAAHMILPLSEETVNDLLMKIL